MRSVAASISILIFATVSTAAQDTSSANLIMPGCRNWVKQSDNEYLAQGVCGGAIFAIREIAAGVCAPTGSTGGQAVRIVVQYIDSIPARHHENFYRLAAEALRRAWPCRN